MQPARGRAHVFGDGRRKRDHIVLGGLFDRGDARDIELAALADVARRFLRNDSRLRHHLRSRDFHLQPGFVSPLFAPDAPHVGVGVARNH